MPAMPYLTSTTDVQFILSAFTGKLRGNMLKTITTVIQIIERILRKEPRALGSVK